jgi:hypothetical protein
MDERLHGAVESIVVAHREAARMGMEGRGKVELHNNLIYSKASKGRCRST